DNREFFQAELSEADFSKPQAVKAINHWADRHTRGKIKEIVQFPFSDETRLILANAVYFKGTWLKPFKTGASRPREFHLAGGQTRQVPMMSQFGTFAYRGTDDFQAVKLPYRGGLQMELYLPQTNSNPQNILAGLAARDWNKAAQTGFAEGEGSVTLPKFKIEYDLSLNEVLKALGMKSAFVLGADFSGIANEPLYISEVKQKGFVDVNEEGTEAAAVTSGKITALSVRARFDMVLNRPFLFLISDVKTGSILFAGVMNDPASGN
ncbi:MAG: serpin family protein, partial [Verrucomicrobiae bacterium]|nr:serpin family protein [Verrucomicrobiae bacterium]